MSNVTNIQRAKERTAQNTSLVSDAQEAAIRRLADDIHRLNHAVIQAVESGLNVELIRSSRHHAEGTDGKKWGDLMVPVIARD